MATTSAAITHPALHVVEILEVILLHLPLDDCVLSQRVCKLWHTVVRSSPRIRQTLFFHPILSPTIDKNGPVQLNPFLLAMTTEIQPRQVYHKQKYFYTLLLDPIKLRPLVEAIANKDPGRQLLFLPPYAPALWMEMLITQPPVTELLILHENEPMHRAWRGPWCYFVENKQGLTLGNVIYYISQVMALKGGLSLEGWEIVVPEPCYEESTSIGRFELASLEYEWGMSFSDENAWTLEKLYSVGDAGQINFFRREGSGECMKDPA